MTKKVKSAGRFGVRYGRKIRQLIVDIEKKQKAKHQCPYCNKYNVKRISSASGNAKSAIINLQERHTYHKNDNNKTKISKIRNKKRLRSTSTRGYCRGKRRGNRRKNPLYI